MDGRRRNALRFTAHAAINAAMLGTVGWLLHGTGGAVAGAISAVVAVAIAMLLMAYNPAVRRWLATGEGRQPPGIQRDNRQ